MKKHQQGSALLLVIVVFATLFALVAMSLERGVALFSRIHTHHLENAALHLAEAGVEYTLHHLATEGKEFQGEENVELDTGTFSTLVRHADDSKCVEILSTGTAKNSGQGQDIVKTLRVLVQFPADASQELPHIQLWEEIPTNKT